MLEVFVATRSDAEYIGSASDLRELDREEIYAATGKPPEEVVPMSFDISAECYVLVEMEDYGTRVSMPVAIFGVGPSASITIDGTARTVGTIWLIARDAAADEDNARDFLRLSKPWVENLAENYDALANYVYAKNEVHIRWLEWCGFYIGEPRDYGPFKAQFRPFSKLFPKD